MVSLMYSDSLGLVVEVRQGARTRNRTGCVVGSGNQAPTEPAIICEADRSLVGIGHTVRPRASIDLLYSAV